MSFSDWLSNLRNRIPAASPRRRNNNRSNSVALQTALKRSTESLEDRTLLSGNSLVVQLPPGGGTSELLVNNDDLVVRDPGGNELLRVPDGQLGLLTIQGTDASDDTLRIDIGPDTQTGIHFDGGVGGFDTLVSVGEVPDQFQYDATGFQAGSFRDLITFSNLEPTDFTATPLIDVTVNIDAMDMLPGTTVTTTISVDGGNPAHTLISFDNGLESFLFNTLSGTLTINGDALDADNIIVEGFGTGFTGNLVIDGQGGGADTVNLNGAVTFAANQSLTVNATTINAPNATSDIATSGTGAINLTATSNIALGSGSSLTTVNGGVALIANSAGTATGIFTGINVDNATIQTTGTGAISLDGHGTDSGGANSNLNGILLQNGATISSTATGATAGTITIDGTGGDGTTLNHGVLLDGSSNVTSVDGAISITGDGGAGNANFNIGAVILGAVTSTGTGANAATITVDGTGGGGANNNYGVSIEGASADITSVAGAVQILGTGGTGGNFHHAVNLQGDGSVQVASAPLTVTGTATTGDSIGVRLSEQSGGQLVSVGSGTITVNATAAGSLADFIAGSDSIIGDATHAGAGTAATGSININADTIDWSGSLSVESDGALTIQPRTASTTIGVGGGVGTLNLDDIELGFLQDGFNSITIGDATSGNIDINTATFNDPLTLITGGEIHDAASGTDINAGTDSVTLDGTIAPGQSPGILTVSGDLSLADDSTYEVEIGGTSPGTASTNHDQISVTGSVTIGSNVTLDLQSFNSFTSSAGDDYVILSNDGSDAVTGTFAGLAEGAMISDILSSGLNASITYEGGDGNDIVITVIGTTVGLNGGNLEIIDQGGNTENNVRIVIDGTNYRFVDGGTQLVPGPGATADGDDILIPIASVTGTIEIDLSGNDDNLEVDLSGGIITHTINYSGGTQATEDDLTFTGVTVDSVTHSFTNANDGSVVVSLSGMTTTVNYTGLEPIIDNLDATDRVFEFTGGTESITLSDDGDAGDGQSMIDSDLGESVTFNNPTGSLTITLDANGGTGADQVFLSGLDSTFDADLIITGGDEDDNVQTQTSATDIGTGDFDIDVAIVVVNSGAGLSTNGGNIRLAARRNILIDDSIVSGGGNITLNSDSDANSDGDHLIQDATINSGGGNIVIGGGADPLTTPAFGNVDSGFRDGVYIHRTTISSGVGNISIRGTGPLDEDGVDIGDGSQISATTGSISIIGNSTGSDDGIDLHGGSSVSTTNGSISLTGTSSGATAEDGVILSGNGVGDETTISTQTGAILITGSTDINDSGVQLAGFVIIESTGLSGAGAITVDGTADNADPDPGEFEAGTIILESIVRSVSGNIDIDGTSANANSLVIDQGSTIQSTGTGADAATIDLTGDGGGIFGFVLAESTVTSVDGDISIIGNGGTLDGVLLFEGTVSSTGTTAADAATITINGTSAGDDAVSLLENSNAGSFVTSVAGNISITGDASGGGIDGVFIETFSEINSTGTGASAANITIMGTAGSGRGVDHAGEQITSVDGDIMITGDASTGTDGVLIDNVVRSTGTGSVSITGTGNSGAATPTGIFFDGNVVVDSGTINATSLVGRIVIDSEQTLESMSNNITVLTTDTSAAGDNIEFTPLANINALAGMVTLTSGDDVLMPMGSGIFADALIQLSVDAGDADTGVGGNFDLLGTLSATSFTGTGGPDNDLIRLAPVVNMMMGMFVIPVSGFDGVATLTGNDGDDTLRGGDGNDSVEGGAGADSLEGGSGNDTIIGGADNDVLAGDAGDDFFPWNNGDGSDMIDGGDDTDTLEVNGSTVTPDGDVLSLTANGTRFDLSRTDGGAGLGAFSLDVGTIENLDVNTLDGDDSLTIGDLTGVADLATINIDVGDGDDTLDAFNLTTLGVTVCGGNGNDTLTGSAQADMLNGNADDDSIIGGDGDDTIMGGGGNDELLGGDGNDTLTGNSGDDSLTGSLGDDAFNGGGGTDRIIETRDANFDLGDATLVIDVTETDSLSSIEEAVLNGGTSANTIDAADFTGNATLMGDSGNDTIVGAQGSSVINGNGDNDSLTGLDSNDTIMGGGGNDDIDGAGGIDNLMGHSGDDTITGGLGNDSINGGSGTDRIAETRDADFDLGDATLIIDGAETDSLTSIEEANLNGGANPDTIDATDFSGTATLMGNAGNDTIIGAQGSSVINGNGDDDSLSGQAANDSIMGGSGSDVIDGGAGDDNLSGQGSADTIIGNLGNDSISGGTGNDLINGSLGNDTISGDDGNDRIQGSNLSDYPGTPQMPIPDLNTINTSDQDSLLGGAGADTIVGAIGADFIDGEAGADIIDAQSGGDSTTGIDTIVGDMADNIFRDPEDNVL